MIERISLNAIKYFYYVARIGSVTQAADQLCVTQSAVSKQIQNLEYNLNISLFQRKNKSLILTEAGKKLFQAADRALTELDDCIISLTKHQDTTQPYILSCEATLAMKWLIPRLADFERQGHGFDLILHTGGGRVDFNRHQIDLAIRRDDFDWGDTVHSLKLADEYMLVLEADQTDISAEIPQKLYLSSSRSDWDVRLKQNLALGRLLKNHQRIELDHFYLCLEACIAGMGRSVMSCYMVEKEINFNRLKVVYPAFQDGSAYYALSNRPLDEDARTAIVLAWLQSQFQQSLISSELINHISDKSL